MHAVSCFCAPSQELEHESHPAKAPPASANANCNTRATAGPDAVELYRQLRAAPADSEDFELLAAAFNRACSDDPLAVIRALEQQALIA